MLLGRGINNAINNTMFSGFILVANGDDAISWGYFAVARATRGCRGTLRGVTWDRAMVKWRLGCWKHGQRVGTAWGTGGGQAGGLVI